MPTARTVVDALIDARLLDPAERQQSLTVVAAALGEPDRARDLRRPRARLVEVVGYLGAALVLAAGALFLVEQWGGLAFGLRVGLLGVASSALVVAGVVVARVPPTDPDLLDQVNDVRRRLASVLFTAGGLCTAFLVGHVVDHQLATPPDVYWPAVAGAAVGGLVAAIGYGLAPSAVGVLGLMGALLTVVANVASGIETSASEGDTVGALFLLGGVAWLALSERRVFREVTVARGLGVAVTLLGAQSPVIDGTHPWLGYALTVVVGVAGVGLYLVTSSWPYLAAAVSAVTLVVPEAVAAWTDGSLGAVGGVLVAGLTLLAASFAGYRLHAGEHDRRAVTTRS